MGIKLVNKYLEMARGLGGMGGNAVIDAQYPGMPGIPALFLQQVNAVNVLPGNECLYRAQVTVIILLRRLQLQAQHNACSGANNAWFP